MIGASNILQGFWALSSDGHLPPIFDSPVPEIAPRLQAPICAHPERVAEHLVMMTLALVRSDIPSYTGRSKMTGISPAE